MSRERNFLIAPSCAGVNFLLTAFLLLTLKRLSRLPIAALMAYLTTLAANTVRISIALWLRETAPPCSWLHSAQFHWLEGHLRLFRFSAFVVRREREAEFR